MLREVSDASHALSCSEKQSETKWCFLNLKVSQKSFVKLELDYWSTVLLSDDQFSKAKLSNVTM
jgi:hypothetical protein